jgi:hypothetical protein
MENPGSGDLGGDQEGRDDGRNADESQELIHWKHVVVPPERFQFVVCAACWLVKIWSEMTAADIVSSARIVMTAIVFMRSTSIPIVAENVRAWRIFRTKPGTMMAVGAASEAASFAGRQGLILRETHRQLALAMRLSVRSKPWE